MNTQLLKEMISNNYVKVNKHPEHNLFIYNYTAKAQYDSVWNEITLMCRGLILDSNDTIIARPFPKFFNFGESENQELPSLPFEVYDKMDGSLGILYWINEIPFVASRGSFNSDQAEKATQMLHKQYRDSWVNLDASKTYLFEIIYPENRIVVDYGVEEKLVLIAVIDTKSGAEFPLENSGFPIVEKYDGVTDFEHLKARNENNKEGYVIKFANDFRIKIKFEEYLRLHRIVTQVSTINIWEYLKENQSTDELLERVPDEFFNWVKKSKNDLEQKFASIENQCKKDFKILASEKETALYFQKCAYPSVLFFMLKNRDYKPIIWKHIRPEFEKPFNMSDEN